MPAWCCRRNDAVQDGRSQKPGGAHEHRSRSQAPGSRRRASRARRSSPDRPRSWPSPTCRCARARIFSASMRSGSTGTWASWCTSRPIRRTSSRGADGKRIGIFLLHGGSGDYKSMEPMAKLFAAKFGCKSVAMTFPGRLYLDDPSRDWPGDTIHPDGSVRTPIWLAGEHIGADQYEVVRDTSMRLRYGTRTVGARQAGNAILRPHGGLAGGLRGRHEGCDAAAFPRRRLSRSMSPAIRPAARWCS